MPQPASTCVRGARPCGRCGCSWTRNRRKKRSRCRSRARAGCTPARSVQPTTASSCGSRGAAGTRGLTPARPSSARCEAHARPRGSLISNGRKRQERSVHEACTALVFPSGSLNQFPNTTCILASKRRTDKALDPRYLTLQRRILARPRHWRAPPPPNATRKTNLHPPHVCSTAQSHLGADERLVLAACRPR